MPAVVDMLLLVTQTVPEADPTRPSQLLRTQILLLYVLPCLTSSYGAPTVYYSRCWGHTRRLHTHLCLQERATQQGALR